MNLITNADVKKFLLLVKAGIKHGKRKELKNYTHASNYDGIEVVKDYYVSLEFHFSLDAEIMEELFADENPDLTNEIDKLLQ